MVKGKFFLVDKRGVARQNLQALRQTILSNYTQDKIVQQQLEENFTKDKILENRIEANFLADEQRGNGGGGVFTGGKITSHIIPDTHEAYDLGSENFRFKEIYASSGSVHVGEYTLKSNQYGMILPSVVYIGHDSPASTLQMKNGDLTLPETIQIGTTTISTEGGGFKVGDLDISALNIKGSITNINQLSNFEIVIKAGDTFVFENVLYVALKDDARQFPDDWKEVQIRGPQGIPGIKGDPGPQGPQGLGSDDAILAAEEAAAARTAAQAAAASAAVAASTITEMAEKILELSSAMEFLYQYFYRDSYKNVK